MTRERISFTIDPRDVFLSHQIGFSFETAAVACAILEKTSGLEPSPETTAPRYLKHVTVPSLAVVGAIKFCHQFDLPFYTLCRFCRDFLLERLAPTLPQLEHLVIGKPQIGNISAAYAKLSVMIFQSIRNDPFEKNVENSG